jgi:hypothetical protein
LTAEPDAQEHPPNWQATQAQNSGEGQKISLCEVPETQSEAREDSGPVVLPSLSGCDGRERGGRPVKILYLHGWNSTGEPASIARRPARMRSLGWAISREIAAGMEGRGWRRAGLYQPWVLQIRACDRRTLAIQGERQNAPIAHQIAIPRQTTAVTMIQTGCLRLGWSSSEIYRSQYGHCGTSSRISCRQYGHGTVGSSPDSSPSSPSSVSPGSHSSSSSSSSWSR